MFWFVESVKRLVTSSVSWRGTSSYDEPRSRLWYGGVITPLLLTVTFCYNGIFSKTCAEFILVKKITTHE